MNRVIKFRAFISKESKWKETEKFGMFTGFNLYDITSGRDESNIYCEGDLIIEEPIWDKIKIMQFTGLKDVKGKEIYEGDILFKKATGTTGNVVYKEGAFIIEWKPMAGYVMLDSEIKYSFDCEIIGNIYQNPELIK